MGMVGSKIRIEFVEKLRFSVTAKDDKREVSFVADQPVADGGTDLGPTPVEMLVGSLGACVGTMITFYANKKNMDMTGLAVDVEYVKEKNPYRVHSIDVKVNYPLEADDRERKMLRRIAHTCIVHHTLETPPKISIKFPWDE